MKPNVCGLKTIQARTQLEGGSFAVGRSDKQHALKKPAVSNTENHQIGLIPFQSGQGRCVGVHSPPPMRDDAI